VHFSATSATPGAQMFHVLFNRSAGVMSFENAQIAIFTTMLYFILRMVQYFLQPALNYG